MVNYRLIPAGGPQPAQTPANVNDVLKLLRSDNRGLNLFLISFHFKTAGGDIIINTEAALAPLTAMFPHLINTPPPG